MAKYYMNGYTPPEGVNSASKVKEYQRQLGVKADGIWGPDTDAAYRASLNRSAQRQAQSRSGFDWGDSGRNEAFDGYYNAIRNSLSVPTVTVKAPSAGEVKDMWSGVLRPSADAAIERRSRAAEREMAEIDADAVSRGMGQSSYVTSVKARQMEEAQDDISDIEAQYGAALAEKIYDTLYKYDQMSLNAQQYNAEAHAAAQKTALSMASDSTLASRTPPSPPRQREAPLSRQRAAPARKRAAFPERTTPNMYATSPPSSAGSSSAAKTAIGAAGARRYTPPWAKPFTIALRRNTAVKGVPMAAVKKTFDIALDIADAGANREFTVVDGDNGNVLAILLTDGGYPVDLTGCRVIAVFSKSDGTACQDSYDADGGITLCGTLNNQVDIELFAGSVAPGTVECELQIYSDPSLSTLVTTAKFNFACRKAIFSGETLTSAPQYPQLTSLMERVEVLNAETAAAAGAANSAAADCRAAMEGNVTTWKILRYS